jgi:hypothetical protein
MKLFLTSHSFIILTKYSSTLGIIEICSLVKFGDKFLKIFFKILGNIRLKQEKGWENLKICTLKMKPKKAYLMISLDF